MIILLGCPYKQKSLQKHLAKRYVIPIYEKMHFPEFQSFPSSSSFRKSKLKNTKEISKNTKEKFWFWNFGKFPFEIFFFSILNFMAAFLRSQRFFWYPYCHIIIYVLPICIKICHIWHLWHIMTHNGKTFDINSYVNMGVKRSVRT